MVCVVRVSWSTSFRVGQSSRKPKDNANNGSDNCLTYLPHMVDVLLPYL